MKPLVLVADPYFEVDRIRESAGVLQFAPAEPGSFTQAELRAWTLEHIGDAQVLYMMASLSVDAPLLDAAKSLTAVVTISVGYESIDVAECAKRGIRLGFAGACLTEATAETAVALLLAASRRIPESAQIAKEGKWPKIWIPNFCVGKALEASMIGIFGMGRIGLNLAQKLATFRPAEIIYHNRRQNRDYEGQFRYVSFDELIARSDFLIIAANVNDQTKGLFGQKVFARMKSDAILVNISRGCIVNTDELYEALRAGKLGGAGLDVTSPEPLPPEHPLYTLSNCVITPHIGSANALSRQRMMALGQANVLAALSGAEMPSPIPLPAAK